MKTSTNVGEMVGDFGNTKFMLGRWWGTLATPSLCWGDGGGHQANGRCQGMLGAEVGETLVDVKEQVSLRDSGGW
jgi:hypothetical protein